MKRIVVELDDSRQRWIHRASTHVLKEEHEPQEGVKMVVYDAKSYDR